MAAPMGLSSHTCSLSATGLMTKKKKKQLIKKRQCDITTYSRLRELHHVPPGVCPRPCRYSVMFMPRGTSTAWRSTGTLTD